MKWRMVAYLFLVAYGLMALWVEIGGLGMGIDRLDGQVKYQTERLDSHEKRLNDIVDRRLGVK